MIVRSKARVTAKGQITIPIQVRKALGVVRGDDIIFEEQGGKIVILPDHPAPRFSKFAGKFRVGEGRTRAETVKFVRDLRDRDS